MRARGGTALAATLAALVVAAPAARARDAVVTSFDGTPIVTHFFPAEGLGPGQRAPTVLVGHGWGGSGETNPNSESSDTVGSVGLGPLRRAGFNVLTWDARGFGGSGGTVMVDSPDFEGRDVQELIGHVARQPEALLDAPGDPRVGMSGASYGGGIQLVTAAIDPRLDAITPTIAWNSLIPSLYKEKIVKSGWGAALTAVGTTAFTGGLTSPAGPQTGNLDPHITSAASEGLATGRISEENERWFESRGPGGLVGRIGVPTLIVQGTVDTLFTPKEAMANHELLRRSGVPLKMIWFCGGHGACFTGGGPARHVERTVLAWLQRHLSGDRSIDTGAPFEWVADDGRWRSAPGFPLAPKAPLTATGSGTLAIAPGHGSGTLIAASPSPEAVGVDVPGPGSEAALLGEPRLTIAYSGRAEPPQTHVYAQIVDTARNLVVGNQVTPIPVTLDGVERTVERPLEPIAAHAGPGSRYRLQIAPATNVYSQQRSSGLMQMSRIDVSLPVVDPTTVAVAARRGAILLIGATRGMRAARPGRPFRVRVRAIGARVRSVRISLRDSRGRRLGRSGRFDVGRRLRRPRIRVSRPLRPGGYRLVATGRSADGRLVKATKRVRLGRRTIAR